MQHVTKYAVEVYDGKSIPEVVVNAFRQSAIPPLGASFISLPQDVLVEPADATPIKVSQPGGAGTFSVDAVKDAAAIINSAKMPVVFAGVSASRPQVTQAIRKLLHEYPMPFVHTYQACGVLGNIR